MTMTRDFLKADPTPDMSLDSLASLLERQINYLRDIALSLSKMLPSVLCTSIVKSTSQVSNAIADLNSHEVMFQVGGKPVTIYKLFAFNTYSTTMYLSMLSMSSIKDGIPIAAGGSFEYSIPTDSVHLRLSALDASGTCPVNGPTDATIGGIFVFGYTIPDYGNNGMRG